MDKKYKEIDFSWSGTLEDAVNELLWYKRENILACGEFNGVTLYSDTVTMDQAYLDIVGLTKSGFDESQRKWHENYEKQQREHKEKIPELTKMWSDKGRQVLTEDRWNHWDKIVPIRLNDLYQGMELGNCLAIADILNNEGTLDEAKEVIENQSHSGMSFGLVCAMIKEFCDRGSAFVKYIS